MPLVPALCTQCGSKLEIDSGMEAGICPHCHTPFVTEKAIHNYNTTNVTNIGNLHADVVQINESKTIDNQVKSGETFIKLKRYESAANVFSKLTHEHPYDYRGWRGLIRAYTLDFDDILTSRETLNYLDSLYENAIAVMDSEADKSLFQKAYSDFRMKTENNIIAQEELEEQNREKKEIELKRQAEEQETELKRQRDEEQRKRRDQIAEDIKVCKKQVRSLKIKKTMLVFSGISILTTLFVLFEIWVQKYGNIASETVKIMSKQMSIQRLINIGVYVVMLCGFVFALQSRPFLTVLSGIIATFGVSADIGITFDDHIIDNEIIFLFSLLGTVLFVLLFLTVYYKKYDKVFWKLTEKKNRLQELTRLLNG